MNIEDYISVIHDFPKPGIIFRDITPLLAQPNGLSTISESMLKKYNNTQHINYIAGLDARGFIIGGAMSAKYNIPLITIRKAGKLPPPVICAEYEKEYGIDKLEVSTNLNIVPQSTVIIVDDLLATGGTALASIDLLRKLNLNILCASFVVELSDLGGRKLIEEQGVQVNSLLSY